MSNKHPVSSEQAETLIETLYDQASQEEPGDDLDKLIMQQAHAAVSDNSKSSAANTSATTTTKRILKWQRFGSIAATFVMVFTIGLLYQHNQSKLRPESPMVIQESSQPAELQKTRSEAPAGDLILEVQELSEEEPAFYADEVSGVATESALPMRKEVAPAPAPVKRKAKPAMNGAAAQAVSPAEESAVKQTTELEAAETSITQDSFAEEKVLIERKSARKKEAAKPAQLGNTQPRSLAPAAAPMLMQESISDFSADSDYSTPEEWISAIEDALANNDKEKAQQLWSGYRESFPDHQPSEALLRVFADDL
ncbi:MAG: hypothetical protein MI867_06905 [Pseudomonadales bacterium]|nr:hypothetical protein [Pseudomonadales bacterium]